MLLPGCGCCQTGCTLTTAQQLWNEIKGKTVTVTVGGVRPVRGEYSAFWPATISVTEPPTSPIPAQPFAFVAVEMEKAQSATSGNGTYTLPLLSSTWFNYSFASVSNGVVRFQYVDDFVDLLLTVDVGLNQGNAGLGQFTPPGSSCLVYVTLTTKFLNDRILAFDDSGDAPYDAIPGGLVSANGFTTSRSYSRYDSNTNSYYDQLTTHTINAPAYVLGNVENTPYTQLVNVGNPTYICAGIYKAFAYWPSSQKPAGVDWRKQSIWQCMNAMQPLSQSASDTVLAPVNQNDTSLFSYAPGVVVENTGFQQEYSTLNFYDTENCTIPNPRRIVAAVNTTTSPKSLSVSRKLINVSQTTRRATIYW